SIYVVEGIGNREPPVRCPNAVDPLFILLAGEWDVEWRGVDEGVDIEIGNELLGVNRVATSRWIPRGDGVSSLRRARNLPRIERRHLLGVDYLRHYEGSVKLGDGAAHGPSVDVGEPILFCD